MANKIPRKTVAALGRGHAAERPRLRRESCEILYDRKLPAGAFVSQAQLVELTGVPVGPLRDALKALEAEGVLTIHPHTGIQFIKPGLELTRSTYQFRGIIEAAAVAVYAETASESEIREIKARHRKAVATLERDGLTPEHLA